MSICVEFVAAMLTSMNDFKMNLAARLLVCTLKFVRLVDWHLGVLITMQQQQGRIVTIYVCHRAGQSCQLCLLLRLPA